MIFTFCSDNPKYKTPFGAVKTGEDIHIVFPVKNTFATKGVFLIIRKDEGDADTKQLQYNGEKDGYNIFSLTFCINTEGIYYYRFEVEIDEGIAFIGHNGDGKAVRGDWLKEWQLSVYSNSFLTPEWLKGGIIYHVFPDRFARIEDDKKPKFGYLKSTDKDITIADSDGVFRANDFYGGNIKGIISKIEYLKTLSVTAIYLSPIFEASSNHRYDTADYKKIDPLFGTEEEFVELIDICHKNNIRIILDGVFNHTGADSIYFNKFSHYNGLGAYQSKQSEYYDWYTFEEYPNKYNCWWGVTVVPSIKKDCKPFQEYIAGDNSVIEKWSKLGVDGWRLDVADELSSQFLQKIRAKLKQFGDKIVIGEVWEDASTKISYGEKRKYIFGSELDGVMNYPFKNAILDYVKTGDARAFVMAVKTITENYPKCFLDVSMTLLGSHDTVRIINELGVSDIPSTKEERRQYRLNEDEYNLAKRRLKIASALQYFLPGVPTVYYGDEQCMQGFEDPINRRFFCLNKDTEIYNWYVTLGKYRMEHRDDFCSVPIYDFDQNTLTITRGDCVLKINGEDIDIYYRRNKQNL